MKLRLEREMCGTTCTIGKLYEIGLLSGSASFICYILEDVDRRLESGGQKIFGKTAIPRGTYEVILDWSNRFQRQLPRLLNVPEFSGIRIHPGNKAVDTEGCLLPGEAVAADGLSVLQSRSAFNRLYAKLNVAYGDHTPITLEIV